MRYRCHACGRSEQRGFFPEQTFHAKYAIIHGVALGIASTTTKLLFHQFGFSTDGWRGGLTSLAVCAGILLLIYGFAVFAEAYYVAFCRCSTCGARTLHHASEAVPATHDREFTVGNIYATLDDDGKYRISKVLAVDEFAVHLRTYANRFDQLDRELDPAVLSLGSIDDPGGFGIGHFPLAIEAFANDNPIFLKQVAVTEDELDGYKLYLESMSDDAE